MQFRIGKKAWKNIDLPNNYTNTVMSNPNQFQEIKTVHAVEQGFDQMKNPFLEMKG